MPGEIDKILKNSSKAELLETLSEALVTTDKAVVVLVEDKGDGKFFSQVLLLGITSKYEALGIIEIAQSDIMNED